LSKYTHNVINQTSTAKAVEVFLKKNMQKLTKIVADFPILKQEVNGKSLVYLDNGASSQKP
jgi:selenocysteine lyase/cysteine desulfurase